MMMARLTKARKPVACTDAAVLLEPADAPLDSRTPLVRAAVQPGGTEIAAGRATRRAFGLWG